MKGIIKTIMQHVTAHRQESEKALEARLTAEVKRRGGIALKLTSQFHRGMPDRLILLPYHTMAFVELKSTGKKPTALQELAADKLRKWKFPCYVVDSTESLETVLERIDKRLAEEAEFASELCRRRSRVKQGLRAEREARKAKER